MKKLIIFGIVIVIAVLACVFCLVGRKSNKIDTTTPIFKTENIKSITLYRLPDQTEGIVVPDEYMQEVEKVFREMATKFQQMSTELDSKELLETLQRVKTADIMYDEKLSYQEASKKSEAIINERIIKSISTIEYWNNYNRFAELTRSLTLN